MKPFTLSLSIALLLAGCGQSTPPGQSGQSANTKVSNQFSGFSQESQTNQGSTTNVTVNSAPTQAKKSVAPSGPTLTIGDGVWAATIAFDDPVSDQLKTFLFGIQTNTLTLLSVPIYFSSEDPRVANVPGQPGTRMLVQKKVVHSSSVQDFSKVGRFSESNTFCASFPFVLSEMKYSVAVKGTFLSDKSARG